MKAAVLWVEDGDHPLKVVSPNGDVQDVTGLTYTEIAEALQKAGVDRVKVINRSVDEVEFDGSLEEYMRTKRTL